MNCFEHSTRDAVGLCKHCCKGLCGRCAVIVDHVGLACAECVPQVRALGRLVDVNLAAIEPERWWVACILPAFCLAAGAVFIIDDARQADPGAAWGTQAMFGAVFLLLGLALLAVRFGRFRRAVRSGKTGG